MHNVVKIRTVKINERKLNKVFNLASQLYLLGKELLRNVENAGLAYSSLAKTILDSEKVLAEIYSEALHLKLTPLHGVFRKLRRTAYDLARKLGKKVNVIVEGGDIAIDKRAVEMLIDPLVHIVRNAIDHGIEYPNERVKAGKREEGTLKIKAERKGIEIVITIEDDGKGINVEEVKRKAIKKGIISADEAEKLTWNDIVKILTTPGFSTKNKATDISGRGVGMDVVKRNVEALGGTFTITSQYGKGTKVTIKIPLTSVIVKSLVAKSSNQLYAIPVSSIVKVMKIKSNTEMLLLEDNLVPVLKVLLPSNPQYAIIVKAKNNTLKGLAVDNILKEDDLIVQPIPLILRKSVSRLIGGIVLLSEKRIAFLLNVNELH
ncbi:MAG: hypothetical protein J7J78_02365 [Thermoprotei archaeon]|nr:hypothetical protein [Thermoprotei archaeon]